MSLKISVINKKGGVGKTPFAFSIAKDLDLFLQSNDNSNIEQIYPEKAKILAEVKEIDDCVYDFGGFHASGVLNIVKNSDVVIVPCLPSINSILRTVETIKEIWPINQNIILLATDYRDGREEEYIGKSLGEYVKYDIPVFYFKNSKILINAIDSGLSFMELYNETAISRHSYSNFIQEYKRLLKKIESFQQR